MEDVEALVNPKPKRGGLVLLLSFTTLLFLILSIIFGVLYFTKEAPSSHSDPKESINPFKPENTVEFRGQIFDDIEGAAQYQNHHDIIDSDYYKITDFYNMKNTKSRTILEKFKTYQQTSEYSCQCASIMMVLEYYGDKSQTELKCMEEQGWTKEDLKDYDIVHNHTERITVNNFVDYLKKIGYNVTTKFDYFNEETGEYDLPYDQEDPVSWGKWIKENLKKGEPVIVQSSDWLGHVTVIIGYDDMGTEYGDDDVLIIADPYDTTDHLQDGYIIHSLSRFYEVFHYLNLPHVHDQDEKYWRDIFLVIHKKNENK